MSQWWSAYGLYVFLSASGNIIWWDEHALRPHVTVDQHAESD